MKILHMNDVAEVASNYVAGLRELGEYAELFQPTIGAYWFGGTAMTRLMLPYTRTKESFQLKNYVRKNQFDILHIHYATIAYMALITGSPYYLHVHGSDILLDIHRPGFRQLIVKALKTAKRVFCSTPNLIKEVLPYRSDVVFIPNPIEFKDFYPQPVEPHPQKRILCISKLDRRKGMEEIMEIMEILWQADPYITFGLFSFGNNTAAYRPFIERNSQRLQLIDRIPHNQMGSLINSFDMVLGQQKVGALGLSELEAMACSKPLVVNFQYASSYPSPPPVLVSSTPGEAVQKLQYLLTDPLYCAKIGQEARTWVLNNHDKKISAQRLLKYYTE